MVLVSRACAEASLEAELAQQMLRQYEKETANLKDSEEIYAVSYGMICNYLDMIFQSQGNLYRADTVSGKLYTAALWRGYYS